MQITISTNQALDIETVQEFFLAGDPVILESWPEMKRIEDIPGIIKREYGKELDEKVLSLKNELPTLKKVSLAISEVMGEHWDDGLEIKIYISACPIASRLLEEKSFLLPYYFNNVILINWATHEMIHFLYFQKWAKLFPDSKKGYFEHPHPVWILSELLAPIIAEDIKIKKIIESQSNIYECWQEVKVHGKTLTEIFTGIYREESSFNEFLMKSWVKYQDLDENENLTANLLSLLSP